MTQCFHIWLKEVLTSTNSRPNFSNIDLRRDNATRGNFSVLRERTRIRLSISPLSANVVRSVSGHWLPPDLAGSKFVHPNSKMVKASKLDSSHKDKYNLPCSGVPPPYRLPYIVSGYRREGLSAYECVYSLAHATNETLNVWTHVLCLVFFLLYSATVFSAPESPQGSLSYPLLSFAVGISIVYVMSVGAHTFSAMSAEAHKICYFFDYAGISFYSFTAGLAFYSYSRPFNLGWLIFDDRLAFLLPSALLSFVSTFVACYMRLFCPQRENSIRTLFYSCAWLYNTFPYYVCALHSSTECNVYSVHDFARHCLLMMSGTFAYVSHIPERLIEGKFDFLGHSHQFLHVLCAMANTDGFVTVYKDFLARRDEIKKFDPPTAANSLGLTAIVLTVNIAIVLWFTKQVYRLKSEKME